MIPIKFSKKIMEKYSNLVFKTRYKWLSPQRIWYKLDWRNSKLIDVQKWFKNNIDVVDTEYLSKVEEFKKIKDIDIRAIEILKYVHDIIKYESDKDIWMIPEKWQTPEETFSLRTGDCEDGAVLIGSFFYHCNIPYYQWSIVAGDVVGGGHSWVLYDALLDGMTYCLDWCYWYNSKSFNRRLAYGLDKNYQTIWFGFNNDKSWKKIKNPNKIFNKTEESKMTKIKVEAGSKRWNINSDDLKKLGKSILLATAGVIATVLQEQVPGLDFGAWTPIAVAFNTILVNLVRKFVVDYS